MHSRPISDSLSIAISISWSNISCIARFLGMGTKSAATAGRRIDVKRFGQDVGDGCGSKHFDARGRGIEPAVQRQHYS